MTLRQFIRDMRDWGWRTAVWNFRFKVGYRIGHFTQARRATRRK